MNRFKPHPEYNIEVFDNLFDRKTILFIEEIVSNAEYCFINSDRPDPAKYQYPKGAVYVLDKGHEVKNIYGGLFNVIMNGCYQILDKSIFDQNKDNLTMQINLSFSSTIDRWHADMSFYDESLGFKGYTILYYANSEWDIDYGGETIFYNNNQEIIASIRPKPGRFAIFDSSIMHSARPPQVHCPYYRYGIATKIISKNIK